MLAGAGFEKLIEALFQVDRRRAGHVIKVITLAIPRERRPHCRPVACVKEIVWAGEVLLMREGGRGVAEVGRMIVEERAAELSRRAAREGDADGPVRHH